MSSTVSRFAASAQPASGRKSGRHPRSASRISAVQCWSAWPGPRDGSDLLQWAAVCEENARHGPVGYDPGAVHNPVARMQQRFRNADQGRIEFPGVEFDGERRGRSSTTRSPRSRVSGSALRYGTEPIRKRPARPESRRIRTPYPGWLHPQSVDPRTSLQSVYDFPRFRHPAFTCLVWIDVRTKSPPGHKPQKNTVP